MQNFAFFIAKNWKNLIKRNGKGMIRSFCTFLSKMPFRSCSVPFRKIWFRSFLVPHFEERVPNAFLYERVPPIPCMYWTKVHQINFWDWLMQEAISLGDVRLLHPKILWILHNVFFCRNFSYFANFHTKVQLSFDLWDKSSRTFLIRIRLKHQI